MGDGIKLKDANGDTFTAHADEVDYDGTTDGKVERVKVGHGVPGVYVDVSAAAPLPVSDVAMQVFVDGLEANTTGLATQTTLDLIRTALQGTLATRQAGTFAYAAGSAAQAVDVPDAARLTRVSVLAGAAAAASVQIGGGAVIPVPAGGSFDEQIPGSAVGADVVVGGTVQAFYVAWVV